MRRSRLVVGLVLLALVAVVAGGLGAWLGARPPPAAPPVAAGPVPIAPGAPERVEPVALPLDPAVGNGLGALDAVLTPDGRTLVTVGAEGRLTVADIGAAPGARRVDQVPTGTAKPAAPTLNAAAQDRHALALAPDGRTVWVTDGWGRRVQVVDLATRAIVAAVAIPAVPTAVAVAGGTVAVGDATGAVTTIDAGTRRPLALRDVADGPVADLVASPDRRRVVLAADPGGDYGPGSVSVVDLADPRAPAVPYSWPVTRPRGLGGASTVVSPDGRRAYVVTGPRLGPAAPDATTVGGVAVLDLLAGREVTTIPGTETGSLALSPDGRRLYLARSPEASVAAGPAQRQLVLDALDVTAITATVTTGGSDIDSGPGGRPIGSLTDQPSAYSVPQLLAAPDGRRLYTLTTDVAVVSLRGG